MEDQLHNLDYSKVPKFSLNNHVYQAKVVSVYDGDTITVVFKFFDTFYRWSCRLNGIDTPELKSKDPDEKAMAIKARDFLREKILGQIVTLTCGDFDKYGRLLATIEYKNQNINTLMVDNGFAVSYYGGTKEAWDL